MTIQGEETIIRRIRKSEAEIKTDIEKALALRPMTINEISNKTNIGLNTVKKWLPSLICLGVVREIDQRIRIRNSEGRIVRRQRLFYELLEPYRSNIRGFEK